jgi:hypothetical protein
MIGGSNLKYSAFYAKEDRLWNICYHDRREEKCLPRIRKVLFMGWYSPRGTNVFITASEFEVDDEKTTNSGVHVRRRSATEFVVSQGRRSVTIRQGGSKDLGGKTYKVR